MVLVRLVHRVHRDKMVMMAKMVHPVNLVHQVKMLGKINWYVTVNVVGKNFRLKNYVLTNFFFIIIS